MALPLLALRGIDLAFGGTDLFTGAELAVGKRDRICIVGRNGSGKSTLLRVAAGLIEPDDGERFVQPGTTMRYLSQEPDLGGYETVRAYVEDGLAPGDDAHRARYLIGQLGLSDDATPATLSGGEERRAALARALAPLPDILLLDEPTNHLDLPAIEWLEVELDQSDAALILVSHDRRLLERLTTSVVWIDRGLVRRLDRGFLHFEAWRDDILEREQTEGHKLDRRIAAEEDWVRYGVTARRKRNQGRLRRLADLRRRRRERRRPTGNVKLDAADAGVSGRQVIEAVGLATSFGARTIVRDLSLRVVRGDRVGIIGPNGAGKTTLVNLLTGTLAPDAGKVELGTNLEIVTIDQSRESLDPEMTLADALTGGGDMIVIGNASRHVVGYLKDFLFAPEQARTPLKALSGGERGRLMLARAFARPSNLLVLDEPTNDLDLETLELLQEMLADYRGTALIVSHDRDFLDRVVTSTLVAEGDGLWREYPGGYSDMAAERGAGIGMPAGPDNGRAAPPAGTGRMKKAPVEPAPNKLSYKDKYALETLPAKIEELHRRIASLEGALAAPDLFRTDPPAFEAAAADLEAARRSLSEAEDRWLEVELRREEIEGR